MNYPSELMMNEKIEVIITQTSYELEIADETNLGDKDRFINDVYKSGWDRLLYELAFFDEQDLSSSVKFIQKLSKAFLDKLVESEEVKAGSGAQSALDEDEIREIIESVPFIIGHEFVDNAWIKKLNTAFADVYKDSLKTSQKTPVNYLIGRGVSVVLPSKIYFHLVENNDPDELPFVFMATYTAQHKGKLAHYPLKNALAEFEGRNKKLNSQIDLIRNLASSSEFVGKYIESDYIFYPIRLDMNDAYTFLKESSIFEKAGIICRIPKWFRESVSKVYVRFDEKQIFSKSYVGRNAISSYVPELIYKGVPITKEEAEMLLQKSEGLEKLKGRWIENDHEEIKQLLEAFEKIQSGEPLVDVLREKAGFKSRDEAKRNIEIEFSRDDWYENVIQKNIYAKTDAVLPQKLNATLRNYQIEAYTWLWGMYKKGFGVCLADDMGLGKTVEMLTFLEKFREENQNGHVLIVVPATLIANWKSEIEKFTPDIDYFVLRGATAPTTPSYRAFVTLVTYQTALKSEYITWLKWDILILDEAQAIKNYYTDQTQKIKKLNSGMRIAMTGTPIENNVLELWSIFDFINPGFLGNREEFTRLYQSDAGTHSRIKELIKPFVLRRLKTDKSIISDLPEKNEVDVSINLTPEQIALYRNAVDKMNDAKRNKRQGAMYVLSTITKLKQICNHPSQYLGDEGYEEERSGKFIALRNICETIYSKREKVLVFTQFREIIPAIDDLLFEVFRKRGVAIHGGVTQNRRERYVKEFQSGCYPYMVLSLKTAGTGLTLTEAQNIIHFDRWWNPAVENQATDRAFRIGQTRDVTVYKFVTANTIEEVINTMIHDKQAVADEYINDIDANVLSKLSTDELAKAIAYSGGDYEP